MGNSPSDAIYLWEPEHENGLAAFFEPHLVSLILSYLLPSLMISHNNLVESMQGNTLLTVLFYGCGPLMEQRFFFGPTSNRIDIPENGMRLFITHTCMLPSCRHLIEIGETCTLVMKHHLWQETLFIPLKRVQ